MAGEEPEIPEKSTEHRSGCRKLRLGNEEKRGEAASDRGGHLGDVIVAMAVG